MANCFWFYSILAGWSTWQWVFLNFSQNFWSFDTPDTPRCASAVFAENEIWNRLKRFLLVWANPYWKIANMALCIPCMGFYFFEPNDFIWSVLKVWLCDFIQNPSPALSKSLSKHKSEDKLDYLKNHSWDFKKYFCSRFLWITMNPEWKLDRTLFSMIQYCKIIVW